ncbi:hypothetical protein Salat_0773500 [Sesamum alatum]|uniref:Uncharacterized protein n=1 Tax=Sesamum alatum TaxID=300844 RepID=A0AAE2CVM9_9LAMI|nr:hypothetical protein Salat_0773500 [Sesamum alatum]
MRIQPHAPPLVLPLPGLHNYHACLKRSTNASTLVVNSHCASCDLLSLILFSASFVAHRPTLPALDSLCLGKSFALSLVQFRRLPLPVCQPLNPPLFFPFFWRRYNLPPPAAYTIQLSILR